MHLLRKGFFRTLKLNLQTLGVCAALALTALMGSSQMASANTGLTGTGGGTPGGPTIFTFNPGTGPINSGTVIGSPVAVATTSGGTVYFTATTIGSPGAMGSFTIKDSTNHLLLQGIFDSINQFTLGSTSLFASFDVTYSGGSELTTAGFGAGDIGTLGLSLSGVTPGSGTGTQVASQYGITFDVTHPTTTTPEPGSVALFTIMGGGLLCAVLLRRKQSGTFGA